MNASALITIAGNAATGNSETAAPFITVMRSILMLLALPVELL